nr:ribonuclease H-like domain-containing protein [Tanacetum cinerariifolium]
MYKARHVVNGNSQQLGVNCEETFSLVVKLATIRTILSLVASRHWHVHQLDVKNSFLHGTLSQTVYMHRHPGISVTRTTNRMFLCQKKYATKEPCWGFTVLTFTRLDLSYAVQQMLIGQAAQILVVLLQVIVFSLATIYCLGHLRGIILCLVLVPRLSTVVLTMQSLRHHGCGYFFESFTIVYILPLLFSVIMSVRILHVLSRYQYADIFTKGLPTTLFDEFKTNLGVLCSLAPTVGGC